jgi:flavodoxin
MKKLLSGIFIAAILLGIPSAAVFAGNLKANRGYSMAKKVLVVFYSRTGNTKKIGEAIAKELNCDSEQIMDAKSRAGIIGWLRSGMEGTKEKPAVILDTKKDPSVYDMVIIGSPVWGSKMSSPVRTYISKHKDHFRQAAFFITCGGAGNEAALKGMEELSGKKSLATLEITDEQIKSDKYAGEIQKFVSDISK